MAFRAFKGSGEPVQVAWHVHGFVWLSLVMACFTCWVLGFKHVELEHEVDALRAQVVRLEVQVRELSAPRGEE
jgi:hypothetical protein